jgi:hypothetical protein
MTKLNAVLKVSAVTLVLGLVVSGCSKSANFSLLSDSATFQQNSASINGKIDILFVIDNSGSMAASQQALADNISRFFDKFDAKGFDYQIAVTTTDAWRTQFGGAATMAQLRDGAGASHSGVFVVTPSTPDRQNVFITNMKQGTSGNGDERAFQSIQSTLDSSLNTPYNFPRTDAFFSIIMLSDADDLSSVTGSTLDNGNPTSYYANPNLIPVQTYIDYLDAKTGVVGGVRAGKYNVNTIGVLDAACEQQVSSGGENKIGNRYVQLSDATGGIKGSICGDFGTTLSDISYQIIQLRTRFYLDRALDPSTLHVFIDGAEIPVTSSTSGNGYMYNAVDNSLSFFGSYVPGPGSAITVTFDPTSIK